MVFSSFVFLFRFLPIFLIAYYIAPVQFRNFILFAGSTIFYAAGEPRYVILLLISLVINFLVGKLITTANNRRAGTKRILFLIVGVGYNIGMLILFKYSSFTETLPLGISFYTFQMTAYIIDLYHKKFPAERSFLNFGNFLMMFPHLTAGPILRYKDMQNSLVHPTINREKLEDGMCTLIIGLGAKTIIADRIALLWNQVQVIGFDSISTPLAWLGMAAYSLELYFDFAGYSMMAIGLGKMLGFEIPMNFDHPYISKSITEFWRRWHITLGKWFRDYIYIPLGGNRKGMLRTILNLTAVWLLTALWHGNSANFILWGVVILCCMVIEKLWLKEKLEKSCVISHVYVVLIISLSWMVFAIGDFNQLTIYFSRLFSWGEYGIQVQKLDFVPYLKNYSYLFVLGALFSTTIPSKIYAKIKGTWIGTAAIMMIMILSLYYMSISVQNPFMYFSF